MFASIISFLFSYGLFRFFSSPRPTPDLEVCYKLHGLKALALAHLLLEWLKIDDKKHETFVNFENKFWLSVFCFTFLRASEELLLFMSLSMVVSWPLLSFSWIIMATRQRHYVTRYVSSLCGFFLNIFWSSTKLLSCFPTIHIAPWKMFCE